MADFTQKFEKEKGHEKTQGSKAPTVWLAEGKSVGITNNGLAVAEALNPAYRTIVSGGFKKNDDGTLEVKFRDNPAVTETIHARNFPDVLVVSGNHGAREWSIKTGKSNSTFKRILPVYMTSPNVKFDNYLHRMGDREDGLEIVYKHQVAEGEQIPSNVRVMATVPTRVNAKALEASRQEWEKRFFPEGTQHPVYCVLSRTGELYESVELAQKVKESLRKTGGSLVFTTAPKTENPESVESIFRNAIKGLDVPSYFYRYDKANKEENPYMGMLAVADKIILPTESISMTSDALAVGKPTYQTTNFDEARFDYDQDIKYNHSLRESGIILSISQLSQPVPDVTPINSAEDIAQAVRDELKVRGKQRRQESTPQKMNR